MVLGEGFWNVTSPNLQRVNGIHFVQSISCSTTHVAFLDYFGYVWTKGDYSCSELVLGHNIHHSSTPQRVDGLPKIDSIACGDERTCCISQEQELWVFGRATMFQSNQGGKAGVLIPPTVIDLSDKPLKIACERSKAFVLLENGDIVAFDDVTHHVFPFSSSHKFRSIACSENTTFFLATNGNVYDSELRRVAGLSNIVQLSLHQNSLWSLGQSGDLYQTTFNRKKTFNGKTSTKIVASNVSKVATGWSRDHFMYQDRDGNLWALGSNANGQLGVPLNSTPQYSLPCQVDPEISAKCNLGQLERLALIENHQTFIERLVTCSLSICDV